MPIRVVIGSETGDLKASLRELGSGEIALLIEDSKYTVALAYSGENVTFVGDAIPGSSKSSTVWRIKKLTYDSNNNVTDIQWAGGENKFNQKWDDRTSLTYS